MAHFLKKSALPLQVLHKFEYVAFIPETVISFSVVAVTYGRCPGGRYLLAPLTGNEEGSAALGRHQLGSPPTVVTSLRSIPSV